MVLALAFVMLFPVTLMRGMSLDGVTYATVARNMAIGQGSFWHPSYTATVYSTFYESPPLAMWFESLWFQVLGDRWWVERLYSVLTAVPTALTMALVWRRLTAKVEAFSPLSWLPVVLWILMPSWFWIYRHNLLENTLGIFTLLAVYLALRAMEPTRAWAAWAVLAAMAVLAAVGAKGPVGLFPLVSPAIIWLSLRVGSLRRALAVQAVLLLSLSAAAALVMLAPEARAYSWTYLHEQVINSLQGKRETVDSPLGRFQILWGLSTDLSLSAALAAAAVFSGRRWCTATAGNSLCRPLLFALLTAASASLPIMISPKQSAYYAAASWPWYCLALALWCAPAVQAIEGAWQRRASFAVWNRRLRWATALVVAATIAASPLWRGAALRDGDLLADVAQIGAELGTHQIVAVAQELEQEWSLQAYLYRHHFISIQLQADAWDYWLESAEHEPRGGGLLLNHCRLSQFRLYQSPASASLSAQSAGDAVNRHAR